MSDNLDRPADAGRTDDEEGREQSESVGSLMQQDRKSRTSLGDVPFNQYTDVDAETARVRSDVAGKIESVDVEADNEAAIQSELEKLLQQNDFRAHTFKRIESRRRFVQLAGNYPSIGASFICELEGIVTSELQHSYADVDQQGGKLSRSLKLQKNAISALVRVGLYNEELSTEITNPLISMMQFGEYPRIQAHAAYGLEQLIAAHEENSVDVSTVCETLRADEAAPRAAAGSLLQTLATESPNTILSSSAEESLNFLIDALDDIIPQVRNGAALCLGSLDFESAEQADHVAQTLLEKIIEAEMSGDTIHFADGQALVESLSAIVAMSPSAQASVVTELCSVLIERQDQARPALEVIENTTDTLLSNESLVQSLSTFISTAEDSQDVHKAVKLVGELDSTALSRYEFPSLLLAKYTDSTDDTVLYNIIKALETIYDKIPSLQSSITKFLIDELFHTCINVESSQSTLGTPSKPEVAIINALGDIGAKQNHNRDRICCLLSTVLEAVNRSYSDKVQRTAADALTTIAVRSGENLPQIVYSLTAYLHDTNDTVNFDVSRKNNFDNIQVTQTRLKVCESLLKIADSHTHTQQYIIKQVITAAISDPDLEKRIVSGVESSTNESTNSTPPPGVFPDELTAFEKSDDSSTDSEEFYNILLPDEKLAGEQTLLRAVERENLIIRAVAAKRLAARYSSIEHPKEAVETLTGPLETDSSVIVREKASKIMRRLPLESDFNHNSMITALTTALEDDSHTVRSQAAQALGDHLSIRPETKSKLVDDAVFDAAVDALVDNMKNDGGSARTSAINAVADIALSNPTVREQTLNELCSTLEALPQEIPTERAEIGAKIRDIGQTDPESRHIVIEHFRKHTAKESIGRNIAAQLVSEAILEGNTDVERSDVRLLLSGITDYNVLLEPHIQTNLPTLASRSLAQVVTKKPDLVEESQIRAALNSEFVDEGATTLLIHIATKCSSRTTLSPA